jgi:poly(A) polymerase
VHPALAKIAEATRNTVFENRLWLVGGAVRDEFLGLPIKNDFDLVTTESAPDLARYLHEKKVTWSAPVIYSRFGTAMVHLEEINVELVTARKESYDPDSRKPDVEPATLEEDAQRRDFTVNTLLKNIHTGELRDPLNQAGRDLESRTLRTPLDPVATFRDDPLRMLRAVRFRWQLGFDPAPGLYEAIRETKERLKIISAERIRDEFLKMLARDTAADALSDLMDLGLFEIFAPEFVAMVGVEQGSFHHLDVWEHTLLVVRNAGAGDVMLTLAALLHDVGKPPTRHIDEKGNTRFFGHESVGAEMTRDILRRLKFAERDVEVVAKLVKNHMRLGSSPTFSPTAARRLVRDMDGDLERLLELVEADANALKPGVKALNLDPIRERIAEVEAQTPRQTLVSPLSGEEIMMLLDLPAGPEIGRIKTLLTEKVLDGELAPGDRAEAERIVREL